MHLARNARSETGDGAALAGPPDACGFAAALPPTGARFAPWGGPAALNAPPTLAASPLRCPPRGRDSRLGAALRRSHLALLGLAEQPLGTHEDHRQEQDQRDAFLVRR